MADQGILERGGGGGQGPQKDRSLGIFKPTSKRRSIREGFKPPNPLDPPLPSCWCRPYRRPRPAHFQKCPGRCVCLWRHLRPVLCEDSLTLWTIRYACPKVTVSASLCINPTHTHSPTHAQPHARTHARTHTPQTHPQYYTYIHTHPYTHVYLCIQHEN